MHDRLEFIIIVVMIIASGRSLLFTTKDIVSLFLFKQQAQAAAGAGLSASKKEK
jgi:hypothetical protein